MKDLTFATTKEDLTAMNGRHKLEMKWCNDKRDCHMTSILIILIMINKYWTFTMPVILNSLSNFYNPMR